MGASVTLRRALRRVVRPIYLPILRWLARQSQRHSPYAYRRIREDLLDILDRTSPADEFLLRYSDVSFRVAVPPDRGEFHRVFERWADGENVYELAMIETLTRVLRSISDPEFIDIGAFVGHYACYAAALRADRGNTYAIEANAHQFKSLRRSIQLNGFSNLRAFNVILSDRVEQAVPDEMSVRFGRGKGVATMTLDDLCAREGIRPTVVKIDVHGSEGRVLGGMRRIMCDSVAFILLELHTEEALECFSATQGPEVLALLERAGFHLFYVSGHRSKGTPALARSLAREGIPYVRLNSDSQRALLLDRREDVFLIASRDPNVERILGPPPS